MHNFWPILFVDLLDFFFWIFLQIFQTFYTQNLMLTKCILTIFITIYISVQNCVKIVLIDDQFSICVFHSSVIICWTIIIYCKLANLQCVICMVLPQCSFILIIRTSGSKSKMSKIRSQEISRIKKVDVKNKETLFNFINNK